ncbi:1-acyl-sn-glycerol-3-phosphate acyltransferase [bacterium]|nr:1-acyl-sn-glycerol-3-phosphate acyltransferase [bacterium]
MTKKLLGCIILIVESDIHKELMNMKPFVYSTCRFILYPFVKLIYKPEIIGKENLISDGGILLCGNHTSYLDAAILGCATRKDLYYIVKKELHSGFLKYFFKYAGTIPVDRKNKNNSSSMDEAVKKLKEKRIVVMFPEGTINKTDDILMPFKYGAVSLAKKSNAIVVPFAITGKFKPFKKGIKLTIGKPFKIKGDLVLENKILEKKVENLIKGENND